MKRSVEYAVALALDAAILLSGLTSLEVAVEKAVSEVRVSLLTMLDYLYLLDNISAPEGGLSAVVELRGCHGQLKMLVLGV